MKNLLASIVIFCALALTVGSAWAADEHAPAAHGEVAHAEVSHGEAHVEHDMPHPEISTDDAWTGTLVRYILLGMFLPAFLIGPIVAANKPAEPVVAHHDDHGHAGGHDDAHAGHGAHDDAHGKSDSHGHGH